MIHLSRVGRALPLGPQGIPIPRGVRGNTKTTPVLFSYFRYLLLQVVSIFCLVFTSCPFQFREPMSIILFVSF